MENPIETDPQTGVTTLPERGGHFAAEFPVIVKHPGPYGEKPQLGRAVAKIGKY